ncbi:MAG: GNAT family N-acetyltransferase [Candidatus Marinimicrobia bacterium]|nr:GNAT family N-acetyltransferase [Candidatus Neomarinimicrobiota bacterium]MBL7009638.1 GNAT family N-acetyltransferase [Candidatus Neomarinimicrobiota bacterium]MBL7029619.1 GNAT family N-acetyltransferase [Candidatus Neomarinimicrobiota bacterium]
MKIKIVETSEEKNAVIEIRRKVFIQEQKIPEPIEIDANEENATYALATINNNPVGTFRWRKTNGGIKLERLAVLPEYRTRGIGGKLTQFVIGQIDEEDKIYLNAQENVIQFYSRYGFKPVGLPFEEAGIPHQKMVYLKK